MPVLGAVLKRAIKLQKTLSKVRNMGSGPQKQKKVLAKLLKKAKNTAFGREYAFDEVLNNDDIIHAFQKNVPIHDYDTIYDAWWYKTLEGEENICWPGKIKYFALTSGTSGAPSKRIPVTEAALRSFRRTGIRQILSLSNYDLPIKYFEKGVLMLGGSSDLLDKGHYYEGDVSGITQAANIPLWFSRFYKPGHKISKERDWNVKLDEITKNAHKWDIAVLLGVPAWIQLLCERIIAYYKVNNIHEIWPNLIIYGHGGVFFEPYKKGFEELLGKPVYYIESYLASEGFIAFQGRKGVNSMSLVLNDGMFFEFIPFNDSNFKEGELVDNPETLSLAEVKAGVDYALLLSTNAGTWRYLIGDTIRFTSLDLYEIIITGRTKHFLSFCGEHLSIENMNQAIKAVGQHLGSSIREFTAHGVPADNFFAHQWYIGLDPNQEADSERIKEIIDDTLKKCNDDYRSVRENNTLRNVFVTILPADIFYKWMEKKNKLGAQNKFPRVLKKKQIEEWKAFIAS